MLVFAHPVMFQLSFNRQGCNLNWSSKDQEQLIVPLCICMIVKFPLCTPFFFCSNLELF